ncbi:hypothetical protein V8B55DRAFT_1524040 [Mucor lusitanicus]|uniref:Uncharacterized protein n=1 Tax=Mucor circinelloides f. lusitanicus TaxID=29924 RepID=A0A8H4BAE1_MUCCL|nr:hypothetical protein FB192DRAFT_1392372 [Mucor lusitanicus]
MWGDPVNKGNTRVAWKDMCNTYFLVVLHFTGFYMIFWLRLLGFAGRVHGCLYRYCLALLVLCLSLVPKFWIATR